MSPRRKAAPAPAAPSAADTPAAAAAAPPGNGERAPFETFAIDFLRARGSAAVERAPLDWDITLPVDLSRRWRRPSLRLIFDATRATLPHGAAFAAPPS